MLVIYMSTRHGINYRTCNRHILGKVYVNIVYSFVSSPKHGNHAYCFVALLFCIVVVVVVDTSLSLMQLS